MKQEIIIANTPSESLPNHGFWTCGTLITVMLSLLISVLLINAVQYQYFVATLDFQSTDSTGVGRDASYFENVWDHKHRAAAAMYNPPRDGHRWDWIGKREVRNSLDQGLAFLNIIFYWYVPALFWVLVFGTIQGYGLLKRRRFVAAATMMTCVVVPWWVLLVVGPNSVQAIEEIQTNGYIRLTERGTPIIEALTSYHAEHGDYPETLSELVPQYLIEIPRANIPASPEFNYGPTIRSYELSVTMYRLSTYTEMPYHLYYNPEQSYAGSNRRIEKWAIINENSYLIP